MFVARAATSHQQGRCSRGIRGLTALAKFREKVMLAADPSSTPPHLVGEPSGGLTNANGRTRDTCPQCRGKGKIKARNGGIYRCPQCNPPGEEPKPQIASRKSQFFGVPPHMAGIRTNSKAQDPKPKAQQPSTALVPRRPSANWAAR